MKYFEAVEKGVAFKGIDLLHALCEAGIVEKDNSVWKFILDRLYADTESLMYNLDMFNRNMLLLRISMGGGEYAYTYDLGMLSKVLKWLETIDIEVK